MSAHTPGPWSVCVDAPNEYWDVGRTIGAANPGDARRVCDVFSFGRPGPGSMAEANARLIAAAPELLEAVSYAIANPEFNSEQFVEMCKAAYIKATGHAKATGNQP